MVPDEFDEGAQLERPRVEGVRRENVERICDQAQMAIFVETSEGRRLQRHGQLNFWCQLVQDHISYPMAIVHDTVRKGFFGQRTDVHREECVAIREVSKVKLQLSSRSQRSLGQIVERILVEHDPVARKSRAVHVRVIEQDSCAVVHELEQ